MPDTGAVFTPQTIPDAAQPVQGIQGSRATFFLRSTPRVFTLLAAGQSNQDFQIAAVPPVEIQQILLQTRLAAGARPSGQTVEFETQIVGTGVVTVDTFAITRPFATTIAGFGDLVAEIVRTRPLATSISGSGSVVADQGGGTLSGGLTLTPETGDQTLTLTEETGDSQTLTSEDPPDSLTLTPA